MVQVIVVYLYYLLIFLLFVLLVLQYCLLCLLLDLECVCSLVVIDCGYGFCVLVVLVSGLVWVLWYGKGVDYYLYNGLFYVKVGLFVFVVLVLLLLIVIFFGWCGVFKVGEVLVGGFGGVFVIVFVVGYFVVGYVDGV